MSTDDYDFFAVRAKAGFGYGSAFLLAARVVAATDGFTPATGQTEQ
jgi:hypothetical protein